MGDVVNLRRARKDRARAQAGKKADANRVAFGRTKAEKALTGAEREIAERQLEGHRLDRPHDGQD